MEHICNKCKKEFTPSKGLVNYCSLACRNSRIVSDDTKTKISDKLKNNDFKPWNVGKRESWITSKCKHCNEDILHRKSNPKLYHSECWIKSSGGYRKGSGNGKKGYYKGIWCDSTYELVWVIYNLDHNIKFERNKKGYPYIWESKTYTYYPDFIVNDQLIEIKGYLTKRTEEKHKVVSNLLVLHKEDLEKEFNYVLSKYGNDLVSLYDGAFV
jgi:hypothetical protein